MELVQGAWPGFCRIAIGGGVVLLTAWCLGFLAGQYLEAFCHHPEALGLDFVLLPLITALPAGFWRDKNVWRPWCGSA